VTGVTPQAVEVDAPAGVALGGAPRPVAVVRSARPDDAAEICSIVNLWADQGRMLPRTVEQVSNIIGEFVVADEDGRIAGCAALSILSPDLAEIRSVAVAPYAGSTGVGTKMVRRLLDEAASAEIPRVFLYTIVPQFFKRLGFRTVPMKTIPEEFARRCQLKIAPGITDKSPRRVAMLSEIIRP
jgi:N-acetylglutamate synthase-like GNAT family acetyltransferase